MSQDSIPQLAAYTPEALDSAFGALIAQVQSSATSLAMPEQQEQFRLEWLGRKQGRLKAVSDAWLKTVPAESRKEIGRRFNELKQQVEEILAAGGERKTDAAALAREAIDVTLPGIHRSQGAEHPIIRTMNEIVRVFQ